MTRTWMITLLFATIVGCSDDGGAGNGDTGAGDDGGGTNVTGVPPMTAGPQTTADPSDTTMSEDTLDPSSPSDPTLDDTTGPPSDDSSTGTDTDTGTTGEPDGTTIYDVQDGTIAEGTRVSIDGVIVTGVGPNGVFLQEPPGGEYSGVWVYSNVAAGGPDFTVLEVGDEIDIVGVTAEYFGRTEIDITAGTLMVVDTGGPSPAPEVLPLDTFGAAATAEPWEGVLVRIMGNLQVTDDDPEGMASVNEFVVSAMGDSVVIDDHLYDIVDDGAAAFPGFGVGADFTAITGPLNFSFDEYKIAPRGAADLQGYSAP